jgi:autotransporter-associated beta strand protein
MRRNATSYAAKFGGGTTTTLNATLTLASGGMIVNGATISGGGAMSFSQPGLIYAGSLVPSTIGVPLGTSQGITKFGLGTLILSGNSYSSLTGGVKVESGIRNVSNSGALGPDGNGNAISIAGGAALEIQGNVSLPNMPLPISGSGTGGGSIRSVQGNNSLAGVVTLAYNAELGVDAGTLALAGPIQGSYSLTKIGSGVLALQGDSSLSFLGSIYVNAGTLDVSNDGALGSAAGGGATTVSNNATLSLRGGVLVSQPLVLAGSANLENTENNNTTFGSIQLAGNAQITTAADSLSVLGPISGGFALSKSGSGSLLLAAANSFTGPLAVTAGTLNIATMNNAGTTGPQIPQ